MNRPNRNTNKVSRDEALECVRKLIQYLGDNPDREGLLETPERVVKSYDEIFGGYKLEPKSILQKTFSTSSREMVLLSNIELYSTCEHHMLPFIGSCHIAYLPNERVIGLSKLARMMEVYARRLQIQEELTHQIATTLNEEVHARGVAVMIEAQHMCMCARGVNKQHSVMRTVSLLGEFQEDPEVKKDFFRMIERDFK